MPGVQELLVIAVVALLVFGPDRLPEIARTAAKALVRFRTESQRGIEELKRAADVEDLERELADIKREMKTTGGSLRADVERPLREATGRPARPTPAAPRPDDAPPPVDMQAT